MWPTFNKKLSWLFILNIIFVSASTPVKGVLTGFMNHRRHEIITRMHTIKGKTEQKLRLIMVKRACVDIWHLGEYIINTDSKPVTDLILINWQ